MRVASLASLAGLFLLTASGQTIQITKGAVDYQVYQRGTDGTAVLRLEGKASGADGKDVEARLVNSLTAFPVEGTAQNLGKVQRGAWSGELKAAPTGGPYKLEVKIAGSNAVATVANLLVGDLWVLAGQSNMEGVGNLSALPPTSAKVNSFDMTDQWVVAADPLHRLPDSLDSVHWRRTPQGVAEKLEGAKLTEWIANRKKGAGVGLPFALQMVEWTGVPIGIVPCAHGGTSMDQWSPALKDKAGESLYGGMVRRVKAVGGRVAGVLWYQGESDANAKAMPVFEEKFKALVAATRADFGQPDLPFYSVQIGRHVASSNVAEWNAIQELQRRSEALIPKTGVVTCVDCNLDDGIHVGTDDFRLLGKRLAALACHDNFPKQPHCGAMKRGPRPVSAKFENNVVRVEFSDVNGKLVSQGRLNGFTIHDGQGPALPLIFRQRVDPHKPNVVELLIGGKMPANPVVWYGSGKDPYVNLRDELGMGALVFGPLAIQ